MDLKILLKKKNPNKKNDNTNVTKVFTYFKYKNYNSQRTNFPELRISISYILFSIIYVVS